MKFLSALLVFLCIATSSVSFAADATTDTSIVRGQVGQGTRLPLYTNKDLDEALKAADACKVNDYNAMRYDCDCVGMTFLELRRKKGPKADGYWINYEAQRKCPNGPAMAGAIYSDCLKWAPFQRGEDYKTFCSCYGSNYGKLYSKNPSDSLLVAEAQKTQAMSKCDVNAPNVQEQEQRQFVNKLKENGTYEKLFPSAKSAVQPKP